jgi:hypothetical protein
MQECSEKEDDVHVFLTDTEQQMGNDFMLAQFSKENASAPFG